MAQAATQAPAPKTAKNSLVVKMAERYAVDPDKLMTTLKQTAFQQRDREVVITNEQMMALLVVADQYRLNPFTKEIYAFPDKNNGIVPVVGIDGWSRIINSHEQFDGLELRFSDKLVTLDGMKVPCPEWIEVSMFRKDRNRAVTVREYLDETYRPPFKGTGRNGSYTVDGPWQTHPKRMLRHKGIIQCARVALGYTGIHDQDEAERIIDMGSAVVVNAESSMSTPMQIEHAKIDPALEKLVDQARKFNAWDSAHSWIMNRYSGQEFAYAQQRLREAEEATMRTFTANQMKANAVRPTQPAEDLAQEAQQRQAETPQEPEPSFSPEHQEFVSQLDEHQQQQQPLIDDYGPADDDNPLAN
nr:phage recombination protein Bet [Alcaligenes faecalis]